MKVRPFLPTCLQKNRRGKFTYIYSIYSCNVIKQEIEWCLFFPQKAANHHGAIRSPYPIALWDGEGNQEEKKTTVD